MLNGVPVAVRVLTEWLVRATAMDSPACCTVQRCTTRHTPRSVGAHEHDDDRDDEDVHRRRRGPPRQRANLRVQDHSKDSLYVRVCYVCLGVGARVLSCMCLRERARVCVCTCVSMYVSVSECMTGCECVLHAHARPPCS